MRAARVVGGTGDSIDLLREFKRDWREGGRRYRPRFWRW